MFADITITASEDGLWFDVVEEFVILQTLILLCSRVADNIDYIFNGNL